MNEQTYHRGQIYYVHPTSVVGSEQDGGRPAIIVSNDVGNEFSRVVEVVYLTTREKKPLPTHVQISSTNRLSIALCEQIETVDKERIGNYINEVSQAELKNLEKAMMISLGIQMNLNGTKALRPITYVGTNRADCPVCGATVRGIGKPWGNWCSKCGQRLDWTEN